MKIELFNGFSKKKIYSDIKYHENPSSGSRVVPCGQTDGLTAMTKLTVAYRNFAKAPKSNKKECRIAVDSI